ncbi:MAG TPA: FtsK/SpoIIIE domain-containing protein [Catenuloplanes sp.]
MPDPQAGLVANIRAALSHALGLAEQQLRTAEAEHNAARERLARTREAAARIPVRVGAQRDQRLAELRTRHAADLVSLSEGAAAAAGPAAPGAAGAPWESWRPTPAGRGAAAPLLRVGAVALPTGAAVPGLVPLLDHSHLVVDGAGPAGDGVVAAVLLRALGCAGPGTVRLTGYDPEHLGGGLAGFAPLAPAGLLRFVGPGGLGGLLDELVDHIRRINETVLAGTHRSLRELVAATGRRPEPWRVAVLLGGDRHDDLSPHDRAQLARVLRTGAACGVHVVVQGLPVPDEAPAQTLALRGDGWARLSGCGDLPVRLDPAPPALLVTTTCRDLAAEFTAGPTPASLSDLLPAREWTESSADGLTAPLGESPQGRPVTVTLSDYPPHALIAGPSGTGKTNLIYAWMGSLAARYSPTELEFYLLDFKEGVSFARFAPGRRDQSWLPHVRLVGVNVNTDREFGLALLRFLGGELRRRADAAKQHEVTKLAELRAEDPDGHWPRIVAVVDEFQVLLSGRDAVANEAADLLEDLARRGRSQGIHLVLASQDVTGIEALWGRPSLVAQFALRIALPKARRILSETNTAAETLPRHHAVVNADSGASPANQVVRLPAAGDRVGWSDLQRRLWQRRPAGLAPPRLFDGDAVPRLEQAPDFAALPAAPPGAAPTALLGEIIDVRAGSARLLLRRAPGRNLAVLGTRVDEATAVLHAAARSLAAQYPTGTARFSVACLDPDAGDAVAALRPWLPPDTGWYDDTDVVALLADTAADLGADNPVPHFVLLYAVDAAADRLVVKTARGSGREQLRDILHRGPERRTHVLGWWRQVPRLREDLGGPAARTDPIGAWVALDVHGSELAPLYPGPGGPLWYPRPWRALYCDRSVHRTAETIIPYGPS